MFTKSCGPPSWLPEDALCHIKVLHTGRTGRTWQQRFILSEEGCRYGLRRRNTSGLKWGVCICMMGGDAWCGGVLDRSASLLSLSSPYRTVLSVSRSQSLGGGRKEEEAVAGCWSTASSGTKARLSPLKDIAGSGEWEERKSRRGHHQV